MRKFTGCAVAIALAGFLGACGFSQTYEPTGPGPTLSSGALSSSGTVAPGSSSSSDSLSSSSAAGSSAASSSSAGLLPADFLVKVPAGTFERNVGVVQVRSFRMARTETTRALYRNLLGEMPSYPVTHGDSLPVTGVSWYDAARFCNALSKALGLDTVYQYSSRGVGGVLLDLQIRAGVNGARLPTEAEWEYALRAGSSTTYFWGDDMSAEASRYLHVYEPGVTSSESVVAQFEPNAYGLHDMAGNVWEWVQDWYGPYEPLDLDNPGGASSGVKRCMRGGAWNSPLTDMKSASRFQLYPDDSSTDLGFRVVLP